MSRDQVTSKSSYSDPHTQLPEPTTEKSSEAAQQPMVAGMCGTDNGASNNSQAQTVFKPATGMLSPPSSVIEEVERIMNDFEREYEAMNSKEEFEFDEEDFTSLQGLALAPARGHGPAGLRPRTADSPEDDSPMPADPLEAARRSTSSKRVSKWEEGTSAHTNCHSQVAKDQKAREA